MEVYFKLMQCAGGQVIQAEFDNTRYIFGADEIPFFWPLSVDLQMKTALPETHR